MRRFVTALLSAPIHAYRLLVSPLMPGSCRFSPSCSAYALDALDQHGPVKGLWLTARRLARCHPISWLGGSSGFDPVPLSKRHPKGIL
jgi:putative membrane protein insertion efficiency factor